MFLGLQVCVKMCSIGPKWILILLYNVEFNFEEPVIIFAEQLIKIVMAKAYYTY
jgi:hypothetical protein